MGDEGSTDMIQGYRQDLDAERWVWLGRIGNSYVFRFCTGSQETLLKLSPEAFDAIISLRSAVDGPNPHWEVRMSPPHTDIDQPVTLATGDEKA